jgi:hypothetical protein
VLFVVNGLIKGEIEKPSGQFLSLNSNLRHFSCFTFIFVLFGESYLLISCCEGDRCGMVGSDENHGRSRRPSLEDRGWSHRSGTRWPVDREVG